MKIDLEPRLRALLAERGRPDETAVTGLLEGIDALPRRRVEHWVRNAAAGLTDDTTLWLDAEGSPVAASVIFSRPGPGHCGWEAVTFLHLGDTQYLRDPEGTLDGSTDQRYAEVETLPEDAVDTGWRTSAWQLFTVPDKRVVYVRNDDGSIERWGRASDGFGCV